MCTPDDEDRVEQSRRIQAVSVFSHVTCEWSPAAAVLGLDASDAQDVSQSVRWGVRRDGPESKPRHPRHQPTARSDVDPAASKQTTNPHDGRPFARFVPSRTSSSTDFVKM